MQLVRAMSVCVLALAAVALSGCLYPEGMLGGSRPAPPPPRATAPVDRTKYPITMDELDELTYAYADTYMTLMASACDQIVRDSDNPEIRADAEHLKLVSGLSIYDIVTSGDPFQQLLDLTTTVCLQHRLWVTEGKAEKTLGPNGGKVLNFALTRLRDEILDLDRRVLKEEQVQTLLDAVADWRSKNPDVRSVALVRFSDAASTYEEAELAAVPHGTGFLAPVSDAVESIEKARRLGENTFAFAKRLPLIMGWQFDDSLSRLFLKPEMKDALASLKAGGEGLKQLGEEVGKLPADLRAEREAFFTDIEHRQAAFDASLRHLEEAAASGTKLATTLKEVVASSGPLSEQLGKSADSLRQAFQNADEFASKLQAIEKAGEVFDGRGVSVAAERISAAAAELTKTLQSAEALLKSEAWTKGISQFDGLTEKRMLEAHAAGADLTDRIFWRTLIAIGALLAAAIIYRTYSVWLTRRA